MVVDVGGGTTEVAVISLGGIVTSQSIRVGGDEMDQAIIVFAKKQYSLMLGERTAEEIKMAVGSACPSPDEPHAEIRGRDLVIGLPKTHRVWCPRSGVAVQPGSAADVELAVALGHGRPPEWQHPGEHQVTEVQAGHLGEDPLRSADHPAGPDVVGRAVPGAHQAAVLIDAAARQVSAEVPASAGDREVASAGVPDGIPPRAHHLARREIGSCANPLLCAHRVLPF
jgi:hypothetical protein